MAAETAVDFFERVRQREHGIVTYGMTPPKTTTAGTALTEVGEKHAARLRHLAVDAVVMYDIHDEADRMGDKPRPFPFCDTHDGIQYAEEQLIPRGVNQPFVHFRCIAKYGVKDEFDAFLTRPQAEQHATVLAGGSASHQVLPFTLGDAYATRQTLRPGMLIGGIAMAERHAEKGDEHKRMLRKQVEGGCSFFITQCCYNAEEAKNLLSDYCHLCRSEGVPMVPILITLTPCGSAKTFEFLQWLGVRVSKWLANDLSSPSREGGILGESVEALVDMFTDIAQFARCRGIPIGANIESVAIRKAEIDASIEMVTVARDILSRPIRYWRSTTATPAPAAEVPADAQPATA